MAEEIRLSEKGGEKLSEAGIPSYLSSPPTFHHPLPSLLTPNTRLVVFMVALATFFNIVICLDVLGRGNSELFQEGAFVEDLSFFSFLCASVTLYASTFYRRGYDRHLTIIFATACLMFFLREVDVGELNIPQPIKAITSNDTKDILMTITFILLFLHFLRCYRARLKQASLLFKTMVARLVLVGVVLFLVAATFEQIHAVFLEELLETNAAFFILLAALIHILDPTSLTAGQEQE